MCKELGYTFKNAIYRINGVYESQIFSGSALTLRCKFGLLSPDIFGSRTSWCARKYSVLYF